MTRPEEILEMRGMRRKEIINYFILLGGKHEADGKFTGPDWEVGIGEERLVALGSLEIPSTTVIFRCREDLLEKMVSAFRLKFLTAGG